MSRGQRRRRELLDRQADAFTRAVVECEPRQILCPLCLELIPEERWSELSIEDAPPVQYGGGQQRCMTCRETCNAPAGRAFENQVGLRNIGRAWRVARANPFVKHDSGLISARTPVLTPMSVAVNLASPSIDEYRLELKSAYLIAYATLGHRYILGAGLDQVRSLINPSQPDDAFRNVRPCATVTGLPAEPGLFVVRRPVPCVMVPHATKHLRDDSRHVVLLPVPGSTKNFYRQIQLINSVKLGTDVEEYELPVPRRLPMHWDVHGHPLQAEWVVSFEPTGEGETSATGSH